MTSDLSFSFLYQPQGVGGGGVGVTAIYGLYGYVPL